MSVHIENREGTIIVDNYRGYTADGTRVVRPSELRDGVNPRTARFIVAAGLGVIFTAATCVFPPAAAGVVICYGEAIRQGRKTTELDPRKSDL